VRSATISAGFRLATKWGPPSGNDGSPERLVADWMGEGVSQRRRQSTHARTTLFRVPAATDLGGCCGFGGLGSREPGQGDRLNCKLW
jgi:hypothetical protein